MHTGSRQCFTGSLRHTPTSSSCSFSQAAFGGVTAYTRRARLGDVAPAFPGETRGKTLDAFCVNQAWAETCTFMRLVGEGDHSRSFLRSPDDKVWRRSAAVAGHGTFICRFRGCSKNSEQLRQSAHCDQTVQHRRDLSISRLRCHKNAPLFSQPLQAKEKTFFGWGTCKLQRFNVQTKPLNLLNKLMTTSSVLVS